MGLYNLRRSLFLVILVSTLFMSLTVTIEPAEHVYAYFHSKLGLEYYALNDAVLGLLLAFGLMLFGALIQLNTARKKELSSISERSALKVLLDSLPIAISKLDKKHQLTLTNPRFEKIRHAIGEEAVANTAKTLLETGLTKKNQHSLELKQSYPQLNNTSEILIEWNLCQVDDDSYLMQGRDITQLEESYRQSHIAQQIINNTPVGVMVVNTNQEIEYVNRSFELITGYSTSDVKGQSPSILKSGYHGKDFYKAMNKTLIKEGMWQGEIRNRRKNGDIFLEWLSISSLKDAQSHITHSIGMFSEITAQEHVREKLHTLAYYDSLTSLANRTLFNDRLERLIKNNSKRTLCVVFIDLDDFKRINDSLGHDIGDQLLVTFAKRLQYSIRGSDTVARWGGDEFIIAIEVSESFEGISHFCNKQLQLLKAPFNLNGRELNVTASIGVSIYGEDAQTASDLIRNADIAMYQAKRQGKNRYEVFSSKLHKDISENIEIENRLRLAIRKQQIDVHFQPQVRTNKKHIIGFEALARWTDEELGNVSPQKFITVAENTGLIGDLSALILNKALEQFKPFHDADTNLLLSVNLSASQLQDDDLIPLLKKKISLYGIRPQQVKLEITEDIFISKIEKSIGITSELKKIGFKISLDDFGTGYSSLSYLKDFDIDELKIDRSFVINIEKSERNKAIITAMLVMAEILSIDCIVEGVETEKQLIELKSMGCNLYQGYFFYKPMPCNELELLFEQDLLLGVE